MRDSAYSPRASPGATSTVPYALIAEAPSPSTRPVCHTFPQSPGRSRKPHLASERDASWQSVRNPPSSTASTSMCRLERSRAAQNTTGEVLYSRSQPQLRQTTGRILVISILGLRRVDLVEPSQNGSAQVLQPGKPDRSQEVQRFGTTDTRLAVADDLAVAVELLIPFRQ